ncbi:hypothetical protein StoSoilB13_36210 (plasmid) [Arthrobacter sp. StoSoilB13]|nr:hypothetical protein StoSoilB13_36210 [Arthrobacter sp. StoSoilB13]
MLLLPAGSSCLDGGRHEVVPLAAVSWAGSPEPLLAATSVAPEGNADTAGVPESVVGTGDWLTRPCYRSILAAALKCALAAALKCARH